MRLIDRPLTVLLAGAYALNQGDCCVLPAGTAFTLHTAAGAEFLEVALPADLPLV